MSFIHVANFPEVGFTKRPSLGVEGVVYFLDPGMTEMLVLIKLRSAFCVLCLKFF